MTNLWVPVYAHEDKDIYQAYQLLGTGNVIRYSARAIRKEPSGPHARISILMNQVELAYDTINIDSDPQRVHLSNSAYTAWGHDADLDKADWPKNTMKKGLDVFCSGLWAEVVASDRGEFLAGDPDLPPATLLVGDFVIELGGTIIFSPPGRGKSYTALLMAVSLDAGIEKLWPLSHGAMPSGYINLERSRESMQRRLAAVNRVLGLDPRRPLPFINARGRTLRDIREPAAETFREYGARTIFLDSISRTGYGDMTADRVVNAIMDDLNATFETWVALGHTPRATDEHSFGSQMFDAAADLCVKLAAQTSADGFTTGISLEVVKAYDTRTGAKATHVLEWDALGLHGVRKGKEGEFPEIMGETRLEDQIRDYLGLIGKATATDIAKELNRDRSQISRVLNGAAWTLRERKGKDVLYGLLTLPSIDPPLYS